MTFKHSGKLTLMTFASLLLATAMGFLFIWVGSYEYNWSFMGISCVFIAFTNLIMMAHCMEVYKDGEK